MFQKLSFFFFPGECFWKPYPLFIYIHLIQDCIECLLVHSSPCASRDNQNSGRFHVVPIHFSVNFYIMGRNLSIWRKCRLCRDWNSIEKLFCSEGIFFSSCGPDVNIFAYTVFTREILNPNPFVFCMFIRIIYKCFILSFISQPA